VTIDPLPKEEEDSVNEDLDAEEDADAEDADAEEERSSPHPPGLAQEQADVEECERVAGRGEERETGGKKPAKKTDRPPPLSVVIYGKKDTRKTREGVECECLKCRRKRNTNGGEGAAEAAADAAADAAAEAAAEAAAAPKKLTRKQAMFAEIDTDGSGEVSIDEFRAYMRKKNASITEKQVQQRWKLLDADGGGGISEKELWG
jgi:hypothetical protein